MTQYIMSTDASRSLKTKCRERPGQTGQDINEVQVIRCFCVNLNFLNAHYARFGGLC